MLRSSTVHLAKTGIKGTTTNKRIFPRIGPQWTKRKGLRALPGDYVQKGAWIVQQSTERSVYYPGMNVQVNLMNDLLALTAGTVEITREVYIPHPTSVDAELVKQMPRGSLWFRYYVHVLPDHPKAPEKHNFVLKALV